MAAAARRLACLALVLAAAGCALPAAPPAADPGMLARLDALTRHACNPATAAELAEAGLTPERVTRVFYDTERGGENHGVTGYRAWARIDDQRGYVVVPHDRYCRARPAYAYGGATI